VAEPSDKDKVQAAADFVEKQTPILKEAAENSADASASTVAGADASASADAGASASGGLFDLNLIVYIFAFASILSIFSGLSYIADLFCQFRVQLAVGQAFIALILAVRCKTRAGTKGPQLKLLVLTILTMILNIVSVVCTTLAIPGVNQSENEIVRTFNTVSPLPSQKLSQGGKNLTMVQFNLENKNTEYKRFKEYISKLHPDIICLQEYTLAWEESLAELKKSYPYVISATREDPFGIAIFSRHPMRHSQILSLGRAGLPSAYCQIEVDGKTVGILDTHPLPPFNASFYSMRNGQYSDIVDFIHKDDSSSFILAGDLNCAPWSACFGELVSRAHLRDTRIGFGLGQSWPTKPMLFMLKIPIDHVLTSRNIDTVERVVGEDLGSDHKPVYVELLAR
jgi:endonuclease/exonuclease/phosphatase (EEP) superfamily protein YafD